MQVRCPDCATEVRSGLCHGCHGTGQDVRGQPGGCPTCSGNGQCPRCRGRGCISGQDTSRRFRVLVAVVPIVISIISAVVAYTSGRSAEKAAARANRPSLILTPVSTYTSSSVDAGRGGAQNRQVWSDIRVKQLVPLRFARRRLKVVGPGHVPIDSGYALPPEAFRPTWVWLEVRLSDGECISIRRLEIHATLRRHVDEGIVPIAVRFGRIPEPVCRGGGLLMPLAKTQHTRGTDLAEAQTDVRDDLRFVSCALDYEAKDGQRGSYDCSYVLQ